MPEPLSLTLMGIGRHEAQPRARPVSEAVGSRIATLLEAAPQWTTPKQRLGVGAWLDPDS